jgi:nickel transport protein
MKRFVQSFLLLPLVVLILLRAPFDAWSHGTDYSLVKEANLAAIEFHYSDGEPMSYAEVLVFSPQDRQVEHQNARTDRHGKFAFCPDIPGAWLITANDGMGHLCEATVEVSPEASSEKDDTPQGQTGSGHPVQGSKILKIIAGLSLIFNLAFAAQSFHRRSIASKRRS